MDTLIEVSVDHHDKPLSIIFEESGGLINFFHTIFGFLYRCTDFYLVNNGKVDVGNPPGTAEAIVLTVLNHWKEVHEENPTLIYTNEDIKPHDSAVCEVEIKFHHQSEDAEQHMPTFESELTNDVDDCDITPVQAEDIVSEVDVPQNGEDDIVIEEVECVIVHRPNLYVQESVHSIAINTDEIETTSIDENPPMTDAYILDRIPQNVITEHVSETIDVEESPVGVFYEQDPHNPSASNAAYLIVHSNAEPRDSDSHEEHFPTDGLFPFTSHQDKTHQTKRKHMKKKKVKTVQQPMLKKTGSSESCDDVNQCVVCRKVFKLKRVLKRHLLTHKDVTILKCANCEKIFQENETFQEHLLTHAMDKFHCEVCGKMFRQKGNYSQHLRMHYEKKQLNCNVCKLNFFNIVSLKKHVIMKHSEEEVPKCEFCGIEFKKKHLLRKHLLEHTKDTDFSCYICEKEFRGKYTLRKHVASHAKDKKYMCNICKKGFLQIESLDKHMRMKHIEERHFKCELCNQEFYLQYYLAKHVGLNHTEIKDNFACYMCGQIYEQKELLLLHLLSHAGEKRFKCNVCNDTFDRKDQLTKHSKLHRRKK